jgi:LmbE family N-acetylglucosaminyl deacetylase|tara:strand:+ start:122 stop:742 length:621 start_codon:yes stop_codon:yes gene_type:complete
MKKLIIAPHIDDDVLGCGGIIDSNTMVLYCGMDEKHIPNRPDSFDRLNEAEDVSEFLGNQYHVLDNKVNQYKLQDLLSSFEIFISEQKPEEIYIPHPSYNQDHRVTYEAVLTALRPHDKNFFVKKVLVYEQPHVFLWDYSDNINGAIKPNYFVPIDIERKIKAYKLMPTQVRSFRSPETLRSMAQLRGQQSNNEYAEAFQIIRWVD